MSVVSTTLSTFDSRRFFEKALSYGVAQGMITPERIQIIHADLAKGMVQIANYFGTAYLRPDIELALIRTVNLISLYLESISQGDLQTAALSLRNNTLLSHSKAGADMLRKLHAMPRETLLIQPQNESAEEQQSYLNQQTSAEQISLAKYQAEINKRSGYQKKIDLGFWLAKKMSLTADAFCDAESLIQSVMLILWVKEAKLKLPNRAEISKLIKSATNKKSTLNTERFKLFFAAAPTSIQQTAQIEMDFFIANELTKMKTPQFMPEAYYICDGDISEISNHDHEVANSWRKLTHQNNDDDSVISTLFLFAASGLPLKPCMLKREAKEVISHFRTSGFNLESIHNFIENNIPDIYKDELKKFWYNDLKNAASDALADNDPDRPDFYMERALKYLQTTCNTTWKERS
ncbi:hypothetical protein [Janthinobacterium sp. B9-8]|uniref:hypothetical protein n=1 Tax=Janthinobacterium sp. B9-8 TaxID=1236179 RepID=UPI000699888E|nr:hypothetical protein [Janthinobacterium sp. B9-8]AMC36908.1 hypothetical protein VN23_21125 [Janthinobacterium sp. B9-8]